MAIRSSASPSRRRFTALVQSSSATTGIVIVLAAQGFITLEAGIALAFGANIGTCVTASARRDRQADEPPSRRRWSLVFNVLGVLIWIPLIGVLASVVTAISPSETGLTGAALLAAETPRQIANAHTIFNIANTILFIGFTTPLAALVTRLIPEQPEAIPKVAKPKYLQDAFIQTPPLALDRIRQEAVRLGEYVSSLSGAAQPVIATGTKGDLDNLVNRGRDLRLLHNAIVDYGRELSSDELTAAESRRLSVLGNVVNNLQHIGETISINLVAVGRERLEKNLTFSEETRARFRPLREKVDEAIETVLRSIKEKDIKLAERVVAMKPDVQRLVNNVSEHLSDRLTVDAPDRAVLFRVENQAVEHANRIYYFAKKIAKEIIAEAHADANEPVGDPELEQAAGMT